MSMFRSAPKWRWPALLVVMSLAIPVTLTATATNASQSGPAGAQQFPTQTAQVGPGKRIEVPSSATPYTPTPAQLAAREKALAELESHRAPSFGRHTTAADVATSGGPETAVTAPQALPTDFKIFKNLLVSSTCAGCGQSAINEPTVANSGKYIMETSNWNIAYSNNGGKTWLNQNPYAFSTGFCCDQQVTYDAGRDIFILLQLDYAGEGNANNGLALSIAGGQTPTSWCTYKFSGAIGGGATSNPDYPKISVSNNNLFVTWNEYPPSAGFARSGLARMPLDALAACAGFSYGFLTRTTEFTFALSQSASSLDTFYWVSNWFLDGTTNGANLRVFSWADNSGSYVATTRAINPYTFGTASCGSPNWCSRLDPRFESVTISRAEYRAQANAAFAGEPTLQVATTAGPSGFSGGKNYVVYNYFKLNSLTYIGNDQTYSTGTNFAYPGCAVNEKGYVGCAMATGTTVPGGLILLQDNVTPTQPWGYSFAVGGVSPATGWGDYIITSPWNPTRGPFQAVLWRMNGSTVEPFYLVWGRGHDGRGYSRWKSA